MQATADPLVIQVDDDPGRLRRLGADTYEVIRASRSIAIPWGSELPGRLTVAEHAGADRSADVESFPDAAAMSWHGRSGDARVGLRAAGMRWRLGRTTGTRTGALEHPVLATAHDDDDAVTARFELGPGAVVTASPIAEDTALGVALCRPGATRPVEVLALRPAEENVTTLMAADAVDISDRCWPRVPRPIEADSYA